SHETSRPNDSRAALSAVPLASCTACRSLAEWWQHRAHFGCAGGGIGAAGRPLQCIIQAGHVDDEVAAQVLLRIGIRPIVDEALAVAQSDAGAGVGRLQAVATDDDARLAQRADIG